MAVMTVVALFYYAGIARSLWLGTPPEAPRREPASPALGAAIALSTVGVLVLGVLPSLLVQYAPVSTLVAGPSDHDFEVIAGHTALQVAGWRPRASDGWGRSAAAMTARPRRARPRLANRAWSARGRPGG